MTLIKKLYKLKRSVYYLGKYIIFAIKEKLIPLGIVLMIIRVHIHFLSQLNNGVLLRK